MDNRACVSKSKENLLLKKFVVVVALNPHFVPFLTRRLYFMLQWSLWKKRREKLADSSSQFTLRYHRSEQKNMCCVTERNRDKKLFFFSPFAYLTRDSEKKEANREKSFMLWHARVINSIYASFTHSNAILMFNEAIRTSKRYGGFARTPP